MKKKLLTGLIALSLCASAFGGFAAENEIVVNVDGEAIDFSVYGDVLPYIENDTTLMPIRAIAENLNMDVAWDGETKTVEISGRSNIKLVIDSSEAEVNGETVTLDVPATVKDDRTFVPLRFVSEAFDADVDWDEDTYTINITRSFNHEGGGDRNYNDEEATAVIEAVSDKFQQFTFEDEETGMTQEYSLYIPENYDETQKYPMIMFIPDATGAGKSAKEIVEQYYGADVWATDEEQEKHASFVLVPAYTETVVDDDWNTSDQIDVTVKLINYLTENYSIDTDRLYTTGQSMGCMTSLYLNSKYPDLFAASLFVSGQWDTSVLQPLENQKFFYVTAGGDTKASGGQSELRQMFDDDGVAYSFGTWSAQASEEEQNENTEALIAEGCDANMIQFETGTVLPEGADGNNEHMCSFNYAYKISAIRDWLFEQTK